MGTLLVYMFKSALCLAMFYMFYRLLLSRETFHRFNRIALLGLMLLSCAVPFVQISVSHAPAMSQQMTTIEDMIMMASLNSEAVNAAAPVERNIWPLILIAIYIVGMLVFLVRELWSIGSMWRLIRSGEVVSEEDGVKVVAVAGDVAPFSWLRYIVLSRCDYENPDCSSILVHERAHIRMHHSYDILLADLCILFKWFNPASWLIKRELQAIHEFEADDAVLSSGINARNYQLLLIKKAVGARLYSIANSLNQSSLKKRITMMFKEKSNPWARAKYAFVLPLTAIAVVAFARPEVNNELREISSIKVSDLTSIIETEEVKNIETPQVATVNTIAAVDTVTPKRVETVTIVDVPKTEADAAFVTDSDKPTKLPDYPDGGIKGFLDFLSQNIQIPEKSDGVDYSKKVIVQFFVEEDGSLSNFNVVRGISPEFNEEALRVLKLSKNWIPGEKDGKPAQMKYTVAVSFKRDSSKSKLESDNSIYIVDGEKVSKEKIKEIDPSTIEKINVLKGDQAVAQYGDDAKDGAVVITLKK